MLTVESMVLQLQPVNTRYGRYVRLLLRISKTREEGYKFPASGPRDSDCQMGPGPLNAVT